MKSLLNIFLIAIFGSFANAITSSGLKTIPITGKINTTTGKTLPYTGKIITSSTVKTTVPTISTTAHLSDIKYYTTRVQNFSGGVATLVIPNNVFPSNSFSCYSAKSTTTKTTEYCTSTSSTTYCEPRTTTIVRGGSFCETRTKKLSFTIPVTTRTCYTQYEKCQTATRKFSETVLPLDSYYKEIIKQPLVGLPLTSSKSLSAVIEKLPPYTYEECNFVKKEFECIYPEDDFTLTTSPTPPPTTTIDSTIEIPTETNSEQDITTPTTSPTLVLPPKPSTPTTYPPKDTKSLSVSYPPKTVTSTTTRKITSTGKMDTSFYTTTLSSNGITTSLKVPVHQSIKAVSCRSTKTQTQNIINYCITINKLR